MFAGDRLIEYIDIVWVCCFDSLRLARYSTRVPDVMGFHRDHWLAWMLLFTVYVHLFCMYDLNRFRHLFKHGNCAKYMTWAILLPIAIPGATFLDALYANNLMDLIVWTPERPCNQYKTWILNKFHWISTNFKPDKKRTATERLFGTADAMVDLGFEDVHPKIIG